MDNMVNPHKTDRIIVEHSSNYHNCGDYIFPVHKLRESLENTSLGYRMHTLKHFKLQIANKKPTLSNSLQKLASFNITTLPQLQDPLQHRVFSYTKFQKTNHTKSLN